MNTYIKRESLRIVDCEFEKGKTAQRQFGRNSLDQSIWGCIRECSYIYCEYNLNPKSEALRYNVFGRTSIW